jgi:putative PIN family toxin of toxin-antitoxin system
MKRVIIDSNVIVTALRSSAGASGELLRLAYLGKFKVLATPALFLEYEEVLKRAEQMLAHGLNEKQVDRFLQALAGMIEPVEVSYQWRPQLSDAADEMVLEAAVNGRASVIATFNERHFLPVAPMFGIKTMRPADLVRTLRK